jgi:hypothetical protein
MYLRSKLCIGACSVLTSGVAGVASADSVTGTINTEWIIATPVFSTLSLPEVQSIDSIVVQVAHTNGNDLAVRVDAFDVSGDADFDLMFQEPPVNFSMGVAVENGTLGNVANYTFVPGGGGGFTAPHTPAGLLNANAWTSGPLAAQDYTLFVVDLALIFDGGAIGTWTINYTPIPEPAACGMLVLAGCIGLRRRFSAHSSRRNRANRGNCPTAPA